MFNSKNIIINIVFYSIFSLFASQNTFAARLLNCSNCGEFGDNLGKVVPNDNLFYLTSTVMRCDSPKKKWQKTMTTFISSEYIWGYKKSNNGITLMIGYKTKSNTYKVDLIEKWFPTNSTMYYHFIEKENINPIEIIDKGFDGHKYKRGNIWYPCKINFGWAKPDIYELDTIENKEYSLERAINVLKAFEKKQYDVNQFLNKNVQSIGVKFELTDLITDLTIKLAKLDNQPKS